MALVNITKRVQIEGKGWRFCEVVFGGNRKIRPNVVLIDGREQVHPEGRYYIDFLQDGQRKRLAAGASAAEAATAADQQTRLLTAHKAATAAGISLPTKPAAGGRSLREAADTYLLEVQAHKKPKTFSAYQSWDCITLSSNLTASTA
jgi:integrase/recombinase XerD